MSLPDELTDAERGFRELSRHVVSLSCSHFVTKDHSDPKYFIVSGFLVSINDNWYLATPSHALESIDQLLADLPERTYTFRIVDHLGPESKHHLSIPFDYQGAIRFQADYEEIGADFGLIQISQFYRRQMKANPQTPIDERNWRTEMDFEPVDQKIVWIPNEGVSSVDEIIVGRYRTTHQRFSDDTRINIGTGTG